MGLAALLTVLATYFARRSEDESARRELVQRGSERAYAIRDRIEACLLALETVRAFYAASDEVRPDEFETFTAPLRKSRPEILLVGWAPVTPEFPEAGLHLELVEAGVGWRELKGFDLFGMDAWRGHLEAARGARVSSLPGGRGGPALGAKARWFVVPVESPQPNARDAPRGFLLAALDLGRCVEDSVEALGALVAGLDLYLMESGPGGELSTLHVQPSRSRQAGDAPPPASRLSSLFHSESFELGGRSWTVVCAPAPSFVAAHRTWMPWVVLALGVVGTVTLARLFRILQRTNLDLEAEIGRRRKVEAELIVAKDRAEIASQAKARFLANVSHEMRTPLNGILGMGRLVLDSPLTVEQRRSVETMRSSAELLLALVSDLIDFASAESGRATVVEEPLSVRSVLGDVAELLIEPAHSKGLALHWGTAANVPERLRGDAARLRQVLVNLVGNAVKFTPSGEVRLHVGEEDRSADHLLLRFAVSDSGPGIPSDLQKELFTPFWQGDSTMSRRHGGMGLGLAISKQMVEHMGGSIGVESAAGQGCTVWFTARFRLEPGEEPAPSTFLIGSRALIVDGQAASRETLCRTLSALGVESLPLERISSLREKLESQASAGRLPDAVLVDASLLDSEAASFACRLRSDARFSAVRLILLAPKDFVVPAAARGLVFDARLAKPIRSEHLRDTLGGLLVPDRGPVPSVLPEPEAARRSWHGLRVLLVEDNAVNQRVLQFILKKADCQVRVASNGREALDVLEASRFDVVLMDCQMPVMDGFEATAELRRREGDGPRVPVIAVTAHALAEERARCLAVGMDEFVTKPVAPDVLFDAIERALAARTALLL